MRPCAPRWVREDLCRRSRDGYGGGGSAVTASGTSGTAVKAEAGESVVTAMVVEWRKQVVRVAFHRLFLTPQRCPDYLIHPYHFAIVQYTKVAVIQVSQSELSDDRFYIYTSSVNLWICYHWQAVLFCSSRGYN